MNNSFTYSRHLRNIYLVVVLIGVIIALQGCSKKRSISPDDDKGNIPSTIDSTSISNSTAEGSTATGANTDDLVEGSTFSNVVSINFGTTIAINNPLSSKGVTITQSNGDVVVNNTGNDVEYIVSGTTANGSVKIYSDKKFKITLNNASIANGDGPALNIQSKKRWFLVLKDGTSNTLTDGATYAASTEDQKGALFTEGQMIVSGAGSLSVKSNYKHGICSDDYVRIRSGNINITGTVSDGIHTNSAFIMDGGTLTISANTDGIECEQGNIIINDGKLNINCNGGGIKASYDGTDKTIIPYLNVNGGSIIITALSGEGMSCKNAMTINKGNLLITSGDDGLNAGTAININGGYNFLKSTSNDGMDSNGTITITGGKTVAIGKAPEAGLDCDTRVMKLIGGIVVGLGAETSGPSATASTIHSVILGAGEASQIVHIEAADGTEALTFQAPVAYNTLLFACSKLKANTAYNIYTGGSVASGISFNGLYGSGVYTKGTKAGSFTANNMVTQVGGTISTK